MFQIPGTQLQARFLESVETDDPQYDIYDIGIQHPNGGIDSVAFGGSFYSLKKAIAKANAAAMARGADTDVTPGAVVDATGASVDVDGL